MARAEPLASRRPAFAKKSGKPEARRRKALLLSVGLLFLLSISNVLVSLALGQFFRPFYAFVAFFCLIVVGLALGKRMDAAVRTMEAGLALLLVASAFFSINREHGVLISFLPAFSLFCLYFEGSRSLVVSSAFGGALCIAWYLYIGRRSFGFGPSLTYFMVLFYVQSLIFLVSSDLRYALLDSKALLQELNHRVRNLLLILRTLASQSELDPKAGENARRSQGDENENGHLVIQVEALQAIEESLSLSSDFRQAAMAEPLAALARSTRRRRGIEVETRCTSHLPFDKAVKLILFLAGILDAESKRGAGRKLVLHLETVGGRGLLNLESPDGYGFDQKTWSAEDGTVAILLRQLEARVVPREDGTGFLIDFDATPGPSALGKEEDEGPRFDDRFQKDTWRPFLGPRNRGRSRAHLKKARTLALYLVIESAIFGFLAAYTYLTTGRARISSLLLIGISAVTFIVLRRGLLKAAVRIFFGAGAFAVLYAVLRGPDSGRGLQLITVQMYFLFALHFLGKRSGPIATVWGIAIYAAWYFFHPAKIIPITAFQTFCISLSFFYLVSFVITQDYRKDIAENEALALHFKSSLGRSIGLLSAFPDEEEQEYQDRLVRHISVIAAAHFVVSGAGAVGDVEPGPAFRAYSAELRGYNQKAGIILDIQAEGRLPAETVYYLLIATGELCTHHFGVGEGTYGLEISIAKKGSNVIFSVRRVAPDGAGSRGFADSPFLERLEARLGAKRIRGGEDEYRLRLNA
jgi:two-component sensor histidine kinase